MGVDEGGPASTADTIVVEFTLREGELLRAYRSPSLAVAALVPTAVSFLLSSDTMVVANLIAGLVVFALLFLVWPAFVARRTGEAGACRYEFSAAALHYRSETATIEVPWSGVKSAERRRRFYWLSVLGGPSFVIPVRALAEAQEVALQELLRTRVARVRIR